MALIEIHADLKRTADALQEIARTLRWLVAIRINPALGKKYLEGEDLGAATVYRPSSRTPVRALTDEEHWAREQEQERQAMAGYDAPPPKPGEGE